MEKKRPHYVEGEGWRYDVEHRMTRRQIWHDYQERSIYMLTLTLANRRQHLFGEVVEIQNPETPSQSTQIQGSIQAPSQSYQVNSQIALSPIPGSSAAGVKSSILNQTQAAFQPTALGKQVEEEWHKLAEAFPQVQVLRVQLMPEHLHVVLFVKARIDKPLGKLVGIIKNQCNKHYWAQLTAAGQLRPKGEQTPPPLFSDNFQDTILTRSGQLKNMMRYVEDNPLRSLIKRKNPELFQIQTDITVNGQTFKAIGNRWLLERPMLLQVRCHNNTQPDNLDLIDKQLAYFIYRCQKGAVAVSPCISEGEKQIAHTLLESDLPLIVLLENGFPPLYKPIGKYFEACAAGLLLMLAPWPYHNEKRSITRQQCDELNSMTRTICTEPWSMELEQTISKWEINNLFMD